MAINSKNKGNTFERKVSNIFSKRFEAKTGLISGFRRNADSGSFFGKTNKARIETHDTTKATFGDIICPTDFRFNIECKHYKSPPSLAIIFKQDWKQLDEWLEQSEQDGKSANRVPIIIMKFNNVPEMVVLKDTMGIPPVLHYKEYSIITLDSFLSLPDTNYFEG